MSKVGIAQLRRCVKKEISSAQSCCVKELVPDIQSLGRACPYLTRGPLEELKSNYWVLFQSLRPRTALKNNQLLPQ